jgi:titin
VALFVLAMASLSSATTHGTPGAPATLTATGGPNSVTLAWTTPTATGDSAISGYAIDYATDGGNSWGTLVASTESTATSYSVSPLLNGFRYHFRVSAINQQGTGLASPVAFATPDFLPGPPTGVVATFGDRQMGLSWTPPVANGGSTLTGFVITWSSPATTGLVSGYATLGVQATSYLVVGLTNGVSYTFTVAGTNAGGTGTASAAVVAVPTAVPSVPRNLIATSGPGAVELTWDPPVYPAGAAVSGYRIERRVVAGGWLVVVSNTESTATSYTVTGLDSTLDNEFRVAAWNSTGMSPMSTTSAVVRPSPTTTVSPTSTAAPATTTLPLAPTTGTTVAPATTTVTPATTVVPSTTAAPATTATTTRSPARGMVPPRPVYIG